MEELIAFLASSISTAKSNFHREVDSSCTSFAHKEFSIVNIHRFMMEDRTVILQESHPN